MAKFIPVEPDKWAEMVKAQAEVERLKAENVRLLVQRAELIDKGYDLWAFVSVCGDEKIYPKNAKKFCDAWQAVVKGGQS